MTEATRKELHYQLCERIALLKREYAARQRPFCAELGCAPPPPPDLMTPGSYLVSNHCIYCGVQLSKYEVKA